MHRPSNVDFPDVLGALVDFLCEEVCGEMPLVWPIHPRTEGNSKKFGLWEKVTATENMVLLNPVGYHEMLRLNMAARVMLTDSGGLQEECCVLGTPCLTLRWNQEPTGAYRANFEGKNEVLRAKNRLLWDIFDYF